MAKQGEIAYLNAIGEAGRQHAAGRPFTDADCGLYLARIGQVLAHLPAPPAEIVDIGCGTGWTSTFLAQRGYEVLGVDIAPDMIDFAKRAARPAGLRLRFEVGDYETLDFADRFDGAVFFDSLHHAENEFNALKSVHRALRPGGICIVSEPGIGHQETAASKHAIELFDVTEKEMPPTRVMKMARSIGFRQMRVYAHQGQIFRLLNHSSGQVRGGIVGWILRVPALRPVLMFLLMVFLKRWSGVVVLVK